MDESKLSKSDANRKPRKFWICLAESKDGGYSAECLVYFQQPKHPVIKALATHVETVLPQDDSIRVSLKKAIRLLVDEMKELSNCGCGHEEGNGLCRTHDALEILERIERASRGEG